jgi:L-alanine-DL-glutamate epimerase-like enolase superfamily enzyme
MSEINFELSVAVESWRLRAPFRITGHVFTELSVLVVTARSGDTIGRGEASGVYYRNDTADSGASQLAAAMGVMGAGVDRQALQKLLPPGGARNALDCALWELESLL